MFDNNYNLHYNLFVNERGKDMENKKTNEFDRIEYLRKYIAAFLQSESKGNNSVAGALNFLNNHPGQVNPKLASEKRKILEALFKNQKFVALIEKEKHRKRNITPKCCNKRKP